MLVVSIILLKNGMVQFIQIIMKNRRPPRNCFHGYRQASKVGHFNDKTTLFWRPVNSPESNL